jgi:hypothetical protein
MKKTSPMKAMPSKMMTKGGYKMGSKMSTTKKQSTAKGRKMDKC